MFRKGKKKYADDDGRTVVDMNVEGMPWYRPTRKDKRNVDDEDKPTRKEKRAMMWAWFSAYLPRLFAILVGFGITIGIIVCWLNGWFIN